MEGGKSRRKIGNFLLLREFQLRYAGFMAAVTLALTAGLGYMVLRYAAEASRIVDVRAMDPSDPEAQALAAAMHRDQGYLLIGLIVFGVAFALLITGWQLVFTHKVAGPIYYIGYQTRRMADGYLGPLRPLRKGDLFHAFFEEFRQLHDALRARAEREAAQFKRLAEAAEKAGQKEIAAELQALAQEREGSLGGGKEA